MLVALTEWAECNRTAWKFQLLWVSVARGWESPLPEHLVPRGSENIVSCLINNREMGFFSISLEKSVPRADQKPDEPWLELVWVKRDRRERECVFAQLYSRGHLRVIVAGEAA